MARSFTAYMINERSIIEKEGKISQFLAGGSRKLNQISSDLPFGSSTAIFATPAATLNAAASEPSQAPPPPLISNLTDPTFLAPAVITAGQNVQASVPSPSLSQNQNSQAASTPLQIATGNSPNTESVPNPGPNADAPNDASRPPFYSPDIGQIPPANSASQSQSPGPAQPTGIPTLEGPSAGSLPPNQPNSPSKTLPLSMAPVPSPSSQKSGVPVSIGPSVGIPNSNQAPGPSGAKPPGISQPIQIPDSSPGLPPSKSTGAPVIMAPQRSIGVPVLTGQAPSPLIPKIAPMSSPQLAPESLQPNIAQKQSPKLAPTMNHGPIIGVPALTGQLLRPPQNLSPPPPPPKRQDSSNPAQSFGQTNGKRSPPPLPILGSKPFTPAPAPGPGQFLAPVSAPTSETQSDEQVPSLTNQPILSGVSTQNSLPPQPPIQNQNTAAGVSNGGYVAPSPPPPSPTFLPVSGTSNEESNPNSQGTLQTQSPPPPTGPSDSSPPPPVLTYSPPPSPPSPGLIWSDEFVGANTSNGVEPNNWSYMDGDGSLWNIPGTPNCL